MSREWVAVAIVLWVALSSGTAWAINTVDLTGNVQWICEGDTQVSLDQKNGDLRIASKTTNVDQTLKFRACHSSHCGWGTGTECYEAPCAEILASEKNQSLTIKLGGFESSCKAEKSRHLQDEVQEQ